MMTIRREVKKAIEVVFKPLNTVSAANSMPAPMTLARKLGELVGDGDIAHLQIAPREAALFASAAVEAWQRGVHSFLVSVSLTDSSPVWASVAGYYSSHYAVRGLAHLLGFFHLHTRRKVIQLELAQNGLQCVVSSKGNKDREHKYYWRVVAEDSQFASDPLYPRNDEGQPVSDCGHRNRANYSDHINRFPMFRPFGDEQYRDRLKRIASMSIAAPPIPNADRFPDIESVQIVAYHRLVRFRNMVDEVLGGSNRFWTVHRNPAWASNYLDFQIEEPDGLQGLLN